MSYPKIHHHIQATIFAKLRRSSELRYKDLKDPLLEPSQFTYHLKELVKEGLVEKAESGAYRLAPAGIEFAQHFNLDSGNFEPAPLSYGLVFVRNTRGEWLIIKRKKQPHIDAYACISGKIQMGEYLNQAAARLLNEQTDGCVKADLQYRGYASIMIKRPGFMTHITGPVWFADNVEPFELHDTLHGHLMWADWKQLDYNQFIPGWQEIIELIEDNKNSYLDFRFDTSGPE